MVLDRSHRRAHDGSVSIPQIVPIASADRQDGVHAVRPRTGTVDLRPMTRNPRRRSLAGASVAILACLALVGCGGDSDATLTPPSVTAGPAPIAGAPGATTVPVKPGSPARPASKTPTTTAAPTGDATLDAIDADLRAAEQTLAALDDALAAAGG